MPNETSERIVKIRIGMPLQNCKITQTDGVIGSRVTISKVKIEIKRTVFKTIWRMGSTLPRTVYGIPTETIDKWIRGKALRYNLIFSSRIQLSSVSRSRRPALFFQFRDPKLELHLLCHLQQEILFPLAPNEPHIQHGRAQRSRSDAE